MPESADVLIAGASPGSAARFSWVSFNRGGSALETAARAQAMEIARALAAQTIAFDRDAVIEELPDRLRAIASTMWPGSPLGGYGLHASLGAHLVAKVAVGWAPSGMIGLRHEALDRAGLIENLIERGVARALAVSLLGDWEQVEQGFAADPDGLDVSRLAGLAEGSLSRAERSRALSQVAYSARCLDRLASTASVLAALRQVLPVLPPAVLGEDYVVATIALALGRPERTLDLLGERPDSLAHRTLHELALAVLELAQGQLPVLDDEGAILVPDFEVERAAPPPPPVDNETLDEEDRSDTDDVLEIVEERVDRGPPPIPGDSTPAPPPERRGMAPARWAALDGRKPEPIEASALEAWQKRFEAALALLAQRRDLLGLRLPPPGPSVVAERVPPDERFVALELALASRSAGDEDAAGSAVVYASPELDALRRSNTPLDAVFPAIRGALRAIIQAAEGRAPSAASIDAAGDLRWALIRARAVAHAARGDYAAAIAAVQELPALAAPEAGWAADRLRRFGERAAGRLDPEEARPLAARLAVDLAHQLGRTLAGTVPDRTRGDRVG